MTSLRAQSVHFLYSASNPRATPAQRTYYLNATLAIISNATTIVRRREASYRVPWWRIAGWRYQPTPGPTAYTFGYLWTVHSLFYMWRDFGQVVGMTHSSFICRSLVPYICLIIHRWIIGSPIITLLFEYDECR
jgi:hypothetical protein